MLLSWTVPAGVRPSGKHLSWLEVDGDILCAQVPGWSSSFLGTIYFKTCFRFTDTVYEFAAHNYGTMVSAPISLLFLWWILEEVS